MSRSTLAELAVKAPALYDIMMKDGVPSHCSGCVTVGDDTVGINVVRDQPNSNVLEFTYTIGWGDCMVGCGRHHQWKVKSVGSELDGVISADVQFTDNGDVIPDDWRKR